MTALQITVSERHLASIAGVRVGLSGARDRCRLLTPGRWPARRDSGHIRRMRQDLGKCIGVRIRKEVILGLGFLGFL